MKLTKREHLIKNLYYVYNMFVDLVNYDLIKEYLKKAIKSKMLRVFLYLNKKEYRIENFYISYYDNKSFFLVEIENNKVVSYFVNKGIKDKIELELENHIITKIFNVLLELSKNEELKKHFFISKE